MRASRSMLRLTLDYAICEKLCIPVQARAELTIKAGGTAALRDRRGRKDRAAAAPLGADAPLSLKAMHARRRRQAARACWSISRHRPALRSTVFAEGPTPDWALPVPGQGRRRARRAAALCLRARRPAARRQRQGRRTEGDRGRRRPRRSRPPSGSTNAARCAYFAAICSNGPAAADNTSSGEDYHMTIKVGDTLPSTHIPRHDRGRPEAENHRRGVQGQEGGAVRGAGRLHADLHARTICRASSRMPRPSRPRASTRSR